MADAGRASEGGTSKTRSNLQRQSRLQTKLEIESPITGCADASKTKPGNVFTRTTEIISEVNTVAFQSKSKSLPSPVKVTEGNRVAEGRVAKKQKVKKPLSPMMEGYLGETDDHLKYFVAKGGNRGDPTAKKKINDSEGGKN